MKMTTTIKDFDQLPYLNKLFFLLWKQKKGYRIIKECDFGQLLELSFAVTQDLRFETSAEKTAFNNILEYKEILIAWDGVEPIDILFYELNEKLKRRINQYLIVNSK